MATNEILPFSGTDTGTNLLTQVEYDGDAQRPIGNQPGVARSKLVNKVLKQTSLMAAALGKFVADNQAQDVQDTKTVTVLAGYLKDAVNALINAAIAALNLANYALLNAAQSFTKAQRGTPVALPALTGNCDIDLSLANNFYGQVTGNLTLTNSFTNAVAGQSGLIRVQQNGASLYNWSFGTYWKHVGGAAAIPAQTQSIGAYDEIVYYVNSATDISFAVRSDVKN